MELFIAPWLSEAKIAKQLRSATIFGSGPRFGDVTVNGFLVRDRFGPSGTLNDVINFNQS